MEYLKNKCNKIFICLLFILGLYSCSEDTEIQLNKNLQKQEKINVSYGTDVAQKYDLYLPADRSKSFTKFFVLIHGGSWISGDKSDLNYLVQSLRNNFSEYAIVNLNYRLASLTRNAFPMQLNDIESAISHLKSNAETNQISENSAFIGISAGAHLSMLYSYKNPTNIEMICSIVGPTNFTDPNYLDNPDFNNFVLGLQLITGENFETNPRYFENLSPYHIVTESAPPTILFYGGKDELVPTSQGIDLDIKLSELNIDHEFTLYENEGHGWQGQSAIDTNNKLISFIKKYF
jgi:acetyl esterase/lipase